MGIRPEVACQLIREYVYLYGAVSPKDGTCIFLILPAPDTECFQIFLETAQKAGLRGYKLQMRTIAIAARFTQRESAFIDMPGNGVVHAVFRHQNFWRCGVRPASGLPPRRRLCYVGVAG
jgi:hypothetical protein